MFKSIQQFFEQKVLRPQSEPENAQQALHLATAALFIEVVRSDFEIHETEKKAVEASLARLLGLDPAATSELIELAEREADESVSLFEFTNLVHQNFAPADKVQIMELLWGVAFADGKLDHHEEHLMRKIQHLLHIPQKDFIAAKLRARGAAQ